MNFKHSYNFADRLLHRVAFATMRTQLQLGDLEDRLFDRRTKDVAVARPVFITGLPRAGTTLLLELCVALPEFASHTYRDMPFVLLPLMWGGFSRRFRRQGIRTERAHGDGMMVDADSPEALEEMIWKTAWPDHYLNDRIVPWGDFGEPDADFRTYFIGHLRNIIATRRQENADARRYVSKNNANIARFDWLLGAVADATIIVPIREPLQHAASLLRQHNNFRAIHAQDSFARRYMDGIGHFDFGVNLRPIDFGGWLDTADHRDPVKLDFWLEYWLAAYGHILTRHGARVHFFPFDRFCENPAAGLARLADVLGVEDPAMLLAQQDLIRPPARHDVDPSDVDEGLLRRANELFTRCQGLTITKAAQMGSQQLM